MSRLDTQSRRLRKSAGSRAFRTCRGGCGRRRPIGGVPVNRPFAAKEASVPIRASGWHIAAVAFVLAIIVLLAGYWQTMESLVWVWAHDGTYQYAFLIFPLSAWVAFTLRDHVSANPPAPSVW